MSAEQLGHDLSYLPVNDKTPKANPADGGVDKMLNRFAQPKGESGNPFIGGVIAVLQEHGGTAPLATIAESTERPVDQIASLGDLKGVFELKEGELASPFVPQVKNDVENV